MEELRGNADGREIHSQDRASRDGVGHAALKDQVHVHQPIAEDGIAERQRQEHQGQYRYPHARRRHAAEQVRDDVKNRERRDGKHGAARDPLHLLTQNGRAGTPIAVPQHKGRRHKICREVQHLHAVQVEAQRLAGLQPQQGTDLDGQEYCARQVNSGNQPAASVQYRSSLGEGQCEMQEQRWLQQPGHHVRPVNDPVKVVQFAGVVEGVEDERHQTENVEVCALGCGPASQQDVQPNPEVHQRDHSQTVVQSAVGRRQNQRSFNWDTLADQRVGGLRPDPRAVKLPLEPADVGDRASVNREQQVAFFDAGLLAWAVDVDPLGLEMVATLDPPDAVVGNLDFAIFLEVDPGKDDRRYAQQRNHNEQKSRLEISCHWATGLRLAHYGRGRVSEPVIGVQLQCHVGACWMHC